MFYKKIGSNIFWLSLEYSSRLAFSLVINALLARQFGIDSYGIFQYVLSLVLIFSCVTFICGAEVLVPLLVNNTDKDKQKTILGNAFFVRLIFGIIAAILFVSYCYFFESKLVFQLSLFFSISLALNEPFAVIVAWLQSQTFTKPKSILAIVIYFLKALLMAVCVLYFNVDSLLKVAWLWGLEAVLLSIGLLYIYKWRNQSLFFCFSRVEAVKFYQTGLPFLFALVSWYIFQRLDVVMIKVLTNSRELGLYTSSLQMLLIVTAFAPILVMSIAPMFVYRYSEINIIKRNIAKISLLFVIISLMICSISSFVLPSLLSLLFGQQFVEALPILKVLIWVAIPIYLDSALNVYLIKIKRGDLISRKWLISIATSIVSYYYFIPSYASIGAAYGLFVGYMTSCVIGIYFLIKKE